MSRKEKKLLNTPINQLTEDQYFDFMKLLDKLNRRGLSQQYRDKIQK